MSLSLSAEAVEGNAIMNSSDEANYFTRAEKKLPRYLQPSSGSCHDKCKYGKHHESGTYPKRPSPRRQNKKPVNNECPVEIWVAGKNTLEVKLTPQCNVKTNVCDNPEMMKCKVVANSVDSQASGRIKSKKMSGAILKTEPESKNPVARVILRKKLPMVTKSSECPISATSRSFSGKESSPMTKKATPVRPSSSLDSSHSVRNRNKRMSSGIAAGVSSRKTSSSSKVSLSRVARGFSSAKASSPSKKQSGPEVKPVVRNQKRSEVNNKHHINDEVQEKTLYVIKMETEDKYIDSDVNEKVSLDFPPPLESLSPRVPSRSKSPSPSSSNHSEQDDEKSEYSSTNSDALEDDDDDDALEGETKHRMRKAVDISSETISPRRLKFRRGRALGETLHNAESNTKLHFQVGGSSDGKPDDCQVDPEKVVLRHQDVQGKEDTRVLLNNVIEETASKLVETRKSKVKALVGAFETVISLQDHKPSASTIS